MFRTRNQPWLLLSAQSLHTAVERKGPRVHRTHERTRGCVVTLPGHALVQRRAHGRRRLLRRCEEHYFGSRSPLQQKVPRRGDQQRRLTRARPAEDRIRPRIIHLRRALDQGTGKSIE